MSHKHTDQLLQFKEYFEKSFTIIDCTFEKTCTLKKALELLDWLQEDLENIGAQDYHQLMRAWELKHRTLTSQCVTEHTLFREETRWPGYYYRGDHMKLDDENWHCLTVSRRDPKTGKFSMEKVPVYHIVDDKKDKKAS